MLANGAVSWRSVKQTLTTTSTKEVGSISCFETMSHGVWLRIFILELRIVDTTIKPLKIFCDNSVVVHLVKNNKSRSQNKHIDLDRKMDG